MRFAGQVYRACKPYWAYRPLSGAGAAQFGGRFNALGRPALYTALSVEGALNEYHQAGNFEPVSLIAIKVAFDFVLDGTDPARLAPFGMTPSQLADPYWALKMEQGLPVPTHILAEAAIAAGYHALLAPSYAIGARPNQKNLVLWAWGDDLPHQARLVDGDQRLSYPPAVP